MQAIRRVWINGLSGRMGLELQSIMASLPQWELIGGTSAGELIDREHNIHDQSWQNLPQCLENCDVLIDFSSPTANQDLYAALREQKSIREKAVLIGTTGLSAEQQQLWIQLSFERKLRLMLAPNTSLGVLLTLKMSEQIAEILHKLDFDIEVLESHHRAKIDAPSGTAKFLAEGIAQTIQARTTYGRQARRENDEIGIASLRGGTVFGEHEVRFLGQNEEITVSHRALSRRLFAEGALLLCEWIYMKPAGSYRLEDVSIQDMLHLLQNRGL